MEPTDVNALVEDFTSGAASSRDWSKALKAMKKVTINETSLDKLIKYLAQCFEKVNIISVAKFTFLLDLIDHLDPNLKTTRGDKTCSYAEDISNAIRHCNKYSPGRTDLIPLLRPSSVVKFDGFKCFNEKTIKLLHSDIFATMTKKQYDSTFNEIKMLEALTPAQKEALSRNKKITPPAPVTDLIKTDSETPLADKSVVKVSTTTGVKQDNVSQPAVVKGDSSAEKSVVKAENAEKSVVKSTNQHVVKVENSVEKNKGASLNSLKSMTSSIEKYLKDIDNFPDISEEKPLGVDQVIKMDGQTINVACVMNQLMKRPIYNENKDCTETLKKITSSDKIHVTTLFTYPSEKDFQKDVAILRNVYLFAISFCHEVVTGTKFKELTATNQEILLTSSINAVKIALYKLKEMAERHTFYNNNIIKMEHVLLEKYHVLEQMLGGSQLSVEQIVALKERLRKEIDKHFGIIKEIVSKISAIESKEYVEVRELVERLVTKLTEMIGKYQVADTKAVSLTA